MNENEIRERALKAFYQSKFTWRTPQGLSKDSGIPIESVVAFLDRTSEVIRAEKPNSRGNSLYALRDRLNFDTPLASRVFAAIVNRPV